MPSENVENYLKSIYTLQSTEGRVTTSLLSEKLQISPPSVSEMLKRLAELGDIDYTPYKGAELTSQGHRRALQIIRRHRLWEIFLMRFLRYTWDEVHEEAERLEHVTSVELENRLDMILGYPAEDPHGDPIPSPDGQLVLKEYVPLSSFLAGDSLRILRVRDRDPAILQHAATLGLVLGAPVTVIEKRSFDGSMILDVGAGRQYISREVADSIFVQRT